MFKKSLTTITIIIILIIASAIVHAKGKDGAGCHGLANAMESNGNNSAVAKQYEAHGCAPTEPPATETPPPVGTEPPATETEPPATETQPPATETEPPASETQPPATETEPPATETPTPTDGDGDGFFDSMDCEPTNPNIYPGSPTGSCDNVAAFGTGSLQITLVWDSINNLDLKVAEPSSELISWSNMESLTGGVLEQDVQCDGSLFAENVYWGGAAPSGSYQIHVIEASLCGGTTSANWILTIREDGAIVAQYYGSGDTMISFEH